MSFEYTLEEVLDLHFNNRLDGIWTACPCVVVTAYDDLRVDVQPLIKRLYQDGSSADRPVILNVPLQMPGNKTSLIDIDVEKGDTVLCVFSQRSLDNFKNGNGEAAAPSGYRVMDRRDAIAIPGIYPFKNSPRLKRKIPKIKGSLDLVNNIGTPAEAVISILPTGQISLKSPQGIVDVEAQTVNTLATTANVTVSGSTTITCPATVWTGNANFTGTYNFTGTVIVNGTPI